MFHSVTSKQFTILKVREQRCPDDKIDARILPIVKAMQKFPGIATVWSCSGHTQEEYLEKDPDVNVELIKKDKMYFVFVTDGSCSKLFEALGELISSSSDKEFTTFRAELQATQLLWGFTGKISDRRRYNCWSLEHTFKNNKESHILLLNVRQKMLTLLTNKLKELDEHQ